MKHKSLALAKAALATLALVLIGVVTTAAHELRHEVTASRVEPAAPQARTGDRVHPTPLKVLPVRLSRVIEGEALVPTAFASAGSIEVQPMQGFGGQWSGGAQLFWRAPAPVNEPIRNWPNLRLRFEVQVGQPYELTLLHTVAPDYGKFRVFLDGKIVTDVDGWAPQVDVRQRVLGEQVLAAGSHEMILTVFDRNPASQGWYVGVDALRLTAAGQSSPKAMKPQPQLKEPIRDRVDLAGATREERTVDLLARIAAPPSLPESLTHEDRMALDGIVRDLQAGDTERATGAWRKLVGAVAPRADRSADIDALVLWVLRQSYLEQTADLRSQAEKVRFFNEQKRAIREHLAEARAALADMPPKGTAELPTLTVAAHYEEGKPPVTEGPIQVMSEEQLRADIAIWEEQLQSVGEDAQLNNIELQNLMQKQQQTLQILSNVLKMLHETAMAIIRNID
jgi:hypothetical protein